MASGLKIGIFDSGLGGLLIAKSLIAALPDYDYLYLGDTKRVPYGNRSQETIYQMSLEAVQYLFRQRCRVIILACNTASAEALRRLQCEYLPHSEYADRRILGVIRPTAEVAVRQGKRIGVLATASTIASGSYRRELGNLAPSVQVFEHAAPLLVPLIENNGRQWASPILAEYLRPLLAESIDTLVLGCTHYPAYVDLIAAQLPSGVTVVAQNQLLPAKLIDYLQRHPELAVGLGRTGSRQFQVTDLTPWYQVLMEELAGFAISAEVVRY